MPKLAPTLVARPRIEGWLKRSSETPVRFAIAPIGFGKTTAIVRYLAGSDVSSAYVRVGNDSPERLRERIGSLLGVGKMARSYDGLVAALASRGVFALALDEVDRAPVATRTELAELAMDAPQGVSLVYIARGRMALSLERAVANGVAVVNDPQLFAFDEEEIAELARSYGVRYALRDVARFYERTEGWPLVVISAIREAADRARSLGDAYDGWRLGEGRHFGRYISQELAALAESDRTALQLALRGTPIEDNARFSDLEGRGLFVRYDGTHYRGFRVLADLVSPAVAFVPDAESAARNIMTIRMLGRFEAKIDEQTVEWIRRRDQQVMKYLLLQPGGAATRAELIETFWPGVEMPLATQSLRTACSNIRKALAVLVGPESVSLYFSTRGDIGVNLAQASIDVRRFTAHLREGDVQLEAGNVADALSHYRAAEELYGDGLFAGDPPETWALPRAQMYEALYVGLLERLVDLSQDASDYAAVQQWNARLASLRPQGETEPAPEEDADDEYRPSQSLITALRAGLRGV